ncbi:hypothetical protein [Listeria booriae]|nr:hypothetical protein [Listeria booriae]
MEQVQNCEEKGLLTPRFPILFCRKERFIMITPKLPSEITTEWV